jgi:hypothetical protein
VHAELIGKEKMALNEKQESEAKRETLIKVLCFPHSLKHYYRKCLTCPCLFILNFRTSSRKDIKDIYQLVAL